MSGAMETVLEDDHQVCAANGLLADGQCMMVTLAEQKAIALRTELRASSQADASVQLLRANGQMLAETNRAAALGAEEASALRLTLSQKQREKNATAVRMRFEQGNREIQWKQTAADLEVKILGGILDGVQIALGIVGCFDPTGLADGVNAATSYLRGNKLDAAEYAVASVNKVGGLIKAGTKLSKLLCTVTRIGHAAVGSYRAYAAYQEGDWMQLGFSAVSFLKALRTACFAAGTQVVVGVNEDGSFITRSIEEIEAGDWVLSQDQNDPTAQPALRQVTAVEQNTVYSLRVVQIRDEETGDIETIRCTEEHPFWTEDRGWVGAESLQAGDRLLNPDGTFATIVSNEVEAHPEGLTVYNLTVDGDHTYFVEDGQGLQSPVWVHNKCTDWDAARRSYWKSMALREQYSPSGAFSQNNLRRMARGLAPQFEALVEKNGQKVIQRVSMELHHAVGQRTGMWFVNNKFNLSEVTPWEHAARDQFRKTGSTLITILRGVDVL